MVLGKVLFRDRSRFTWIVAALVLASAAAGAIPGFMEKSPRSTVESIASSLQPLASAYVAPVLGEQDPLGLLLSVHGSLESVEPRKPIVSWTDVIVLHLYSEYLLAGRPVPEDGGYSCIIEAPGIGGGPYEAYDLSTGEVFVYNNTIVHCPTFYNNIAALAPLDFQELESIGVKLVEGRWPSPGGVAEFAAAQWLASEKGWSTGETVELFPGYHARLVGVFTARAGFQRLLVPSLYGLVTGRVGVVVHPDSIRGLVEALATWAVKAARDPYDYAAMMALYPLSSEGWEPPEYKTGRRGVVPGSALLLAGEAASLNMSIPEVVTEGSESMGGAVLMLAYNIDTQLVVDSVLQGRVAPMGEVSREVLGAIAGHLIDAGLAIGDGLEILAYGERILARYDSRDVVVAVNMDNLNRALSIGNPAFSPIAVTAMLSGVLVVLLVATRGVSDTLRVVVDDLRAPLALLVARGASTRRLSSSLRNLLLATGVAAAIVGGGLSLVLGYGSLKLSIASAALVSIVAALTAARRASRHIMGVEPVEAVRPALRAARVEARRGRLDILIAGLAAVALAIGFYGDPEGLVEKAYDYGTAALALAVVAVSAAFMFTPFLLPAIVKAGGDLLVGSRRIAAISVALAARVAGSLGWAARSGAGRIGNRIAASVLAPASILGGAVAAALSYSYTSSAAGNLAPAGSHAGSDIITLVELTGSVEAMSASYAAAAALLWGLGLVSTYVLAHSLLELVSREIVVARARGASRSQALRLALGLILPASLQAVMIAAIIGVLGYLATVAVVRFYTGIIGGPAGLEAPLAAASPAGLALAGGILASGIIVPSLLALARAAPSDVAGALRRLGWG